MNKEEYRTYLQEDLADYEVNVHMSPGEKRALRKWVAAGNSVHDRPVSKYLCSDCMPPEYDFLDVYRLDRELDADTRGMNQQEKTAYLKSYFGYTDPDEYMIRWEEARKNTPALVRDEYIKVSRESFLLWEYICSEGLREEAADYLKEHKDDEIPFVWEGSFPSSRCNNSV